MKKLKAKKKKKTAGKKRKEVMDVHDWRNQ
jgi:hypothetical protein